ncbi:replication factor-A carboxy-terminal domain protein, partial [Trifolium medium]|nr:replication factor-A carboxy-terminal domain protein [Trifolium medium]
QVGSSVVKGKAKEIILEGTPVGQTQALMKNMSSVVVNLGDDDLGNEKTPNQVKLNESKVSKIKKVVKRVSPQQEDEDDNAPIKLLKRAVKIEKIV